jgi:hypothetical protein
MKELKLSLGAVKFARHLKAFFEQFEDAETWTTTEVVENIQAQYDEWKRDTAEEPEQPEDAKE